MKFQHTMALFAFLAACATPPPHVTVQSAEEVPSVRVTEFTLGAGDTVEVTVLGHEDLSRTVKVDPVGTVHYPFVGEIAAAGMSVRDLRQAIFEGLSAYYVDPIVSVAVTSVQSQKIFVLGEVSQPGIFALTQPVSALEAVARAGGFTEDAKQASVVIIRGDKSNPQLIRLDLKAATKRADLAQNIALENGDVLYVPVTPIANTRRFFENIRPMLSSIVLLEQAVILEPRVEDVLSGNEGGGTTNVVIEGK